MGSGGVRRARTRGGGGRGGGGGKGGAGASSLRGGAVGSPRSGMCAGSCHDSSEGKVGSESSGVGPLLRSFGAGAFGSTAWEFFHVTVERFFPPCTKGASCNSS